MNRLRSSLSPDKLGARKSKLGGAEKGFYIYCVMDRDKSFKKFDGKKGPRGREIYAIPYKDVGAVVSKVDLSEFDGTALEENLNDMEWIESNVRGHEKVIEEVMRHRAVIPFKFGTIFRTEARVREMLEENYHDLKHLLCWFKDKREWAVKVYCNLQELKSALSKSSVRINEPGKEISSKSAGAAYFLRKKAEDILSEEADQKMVEYAEKFYRQFGEYAEECKLSPLWSRETTGKDADMILNATYLVEGEKEKDFLSTFQSLKREHAANGLEFECTGPWPPYNFVPLPAFAKAMAGQSIRKDSNG